MPVDVIAASEFAQRRARLRKNLKNSVGLIFAGEYDTHSDAPFRPHRHFEYLTGITDEPGAVLLLDPAHPVESRREMIFLRPLNPELEKWDGLRLEITAALRAKLGITAVFRHDKLPMFLLEAARRSKSLACLHPLANHTQPVSPDLAMFKQIAERVPGVSIGDRSDAIPLMRFVKSKGELTMLTRALEVTSHGFDAVLKTLRPGLNEFDVQETLEHAYRTNGSRSLSYPPIAGSGINSTVLHYRANDQPLKDGDLI
jgi:Xaa-Pro aminopeptidase